MTNQEANRTCLGLIIALCPRLRDAHMSRELQGVLRGIEIHLQRRMVAKELLPRLVKVPRGDRI